MAIRTMQLPDGRKIQGEESVLVDFANKNFGNNQDIISGMSAANQTLSELGSLNRGRGVGGFLRNVAAGLIPGAARAEGVIRSGSFSNDEYRKYRDNAVESREGFARINPYTAMAANVAGGIAPTLAMLLLTGASGGATAAGAAANTARIANLGRNISRAATVGGITGAAHGFMDNPSEDIGLRLGSGLTGGAFGAGIGGVLPLGGAAIGGARKITGRIARGLGEAPSDSAIRSRILNDVMGGNFENYERAGLLSTAASAGEKGISRQAFDINKISQQAKEATKRGYSPRVVQGMDEILDATRTPEMRAASEAYENFVKSSNPTSGAGLAINNWINKNTAAKKVLQQAGKDYPEFYGNLDLSSLRGISEVGQLLDSAITKTTKPATEAALKRARSSLDDIVDNIYPAKRGVDAQYATAKNLQKVTDDLAQANNKSLIKLDGLKNPEISTTGAARLIFPAYARGVGREIIEGVNPNFNLSPMTQNILNSLGISQFNAVNEGQ